MRGKIMELFKVKLNLKESYSIYVTAKDYEDAKEQAEYVMIYEKSDVEDSFITNSSKVNVLSIEKKKT